MGVFLLRSYCEQKDLFKHVNLPLQHQHSGRPRIVVFDAAGALRSFLRPGKKGLLYDFHHQQSRVRSLVRAFKQAGFELVVFLDLSIPSDKLTTWYRRRVVDAATLKKLNQQLTSTAGKPNLPESLWIPPNGATQLLGDAFQEAGCRVFYSFDDTDKEAAFWAKKNKAYAVITDDTDFMCYEGVDRIWSANIRLPSSRAMPNKPPVIRVMELLRTRLLSSLGLNQVQLQQLAGLLGNDHIKHIAKEDLHALREAHPGQHVVAVLAKQALSLQPALGGSGSSSAAAANGFVAAFGPVLPEVKALVAAAVKAVGGSAAAEPAAQADGKAAKQGGKNAGSTDSSAAAGATGSAEAAADAPAAVRGSSSDPIVARLVNRAVAKVVTAAEQGLDLEDLTEADLDAFLEGEEFEVSHPRGEDEEADESAEGQAGTAAAAAAAPADSAATQVERCKRAMQQYSLKGAAAPVVAGSGDRWLLLKRQILMKSVGLEDMSKTPAHVLLQPLRLAVYAALSLGKVTEYMCVLDEQWRSWANGRLVEVPAPPPKREKRGSKRGGGKAAADGHVHVAVKKLVAAVFAKILGAEQPAAAAEGTAKAAEDSTAAAAADAAKPAAEGDAAAADEAAAPAAAAAAAPEEDTKNNSAAAADEAAAAADAAAIADGIEPAVRKLVSGALAKAVAAANKAAAKANKPAPPYEQLPKPLPQKPLDLATLLVRRLRQLDRTEQQFTKAHENMLLLQVSHRHSVLTAMRGAHAQVQAVRIPDLHAANLFLQAYSMLHTAADGKVPRITALLHVEAFHALCQHPSLVTKVQNSPSDAELAKQQGRGAGPAVSAAAAAAAAAAASAAGQGFRGGLKPGMGMGPGRGLVQPYAGQFGMQQPPRGFRGGPGGGYAPGRGVRGDAAPGAHPPGPGYQQGDHHGGGFRSRDANFGGGYGAARGGYHPAAPVMGGGGRGGGGGYQPGPSQGHWPAPQRPQQRGEALTWQQRQNRAPAGGPPAAGGYYGAAPQEGRPAAASTTSPNQPQWAGYGASGAAYGGSSGRYDGASTGRFEGGRFEGGGSSARYEGGGSSARYEGGSSARYEGGSSARYEGGSGRYEGASGGRYDSSSTPAYESTGANASYGQGYGAASSGSASGGYRGQAAASGGYGSSSYSNSSYGAGGSGAGGSGAAYGSSGYASGYGTGGSAAGSGGYVSGGYQQQQGYGSGGQQYGSQQYGSGYQQQQGAGGYGGHQQYSSSAQPSGGYGGGGRGGAGGGERGAPAGGDRGGRQHAAAAVAPASGASSSAGLTWQQQQMVRATGQQPPRGPPGAIPARQGSGGWQ